MVSGSTLHPTPAQGTLHDIFSGTCVTNTNPYNYSRQSISKPLALGISPKIKAQIWSHEYIDLGFLINAKFAKHRYSMVEPPEGGVALEKQNPPAYRFESVAHWLSAFHIYVSIYCEKYPHEVGPLMKYAHTIPNLARRSCDLVTYIYDQTFCRWREAAWVHLPWDQVNSELHNDAMHLGIQIKLNQNGKSNKHGTKTFPKLPFPIRPSNEGGNKAKHAYCYSFNNNKGKCERGQICLFRTCVKNVGPTSSTNMPKRATTRVYVQIKYHQ